MDVEYIDPFVEAVGSVFTTMLSVEPKRTQDRISTDQSGGHVLTSLIGISGQVSGVVALRFPPATALRLAGAMLGDEPAEINDEVVDVISELANIVAGNAKAKFNHEPPLQLGLPTVVEGAGYRLKYPSGSIWLEVPFTSSAGGFSLVVTYNPK